MNELIYALIILFIIRIVGLLTCVEFFQEKKDSKEIYLILSLVLQIVVSIMQIMLQFEVNEDIKVYLLFFNIFLALIQYYFLDILGITRYYHDLNEKIAIFLLLLSLVCIVLGYITGGINTAGIFSLFFLLCIQGYMFINPLINFKEFKSKIGTSGIWYYATFTSSILLIPIGIYLISRGYTWEGLYNGESNFMLFLLQIFITIPHIFLILFIIHLEYISTNEQKNDLKDKYSHNLGNIMQALYAIEYIIENDGKYNIIEAPLVLFKNKLDEASKLITEIRKL